MDGTTAFHPTESSMGFTWGGSEGVTFDNAAAPSPMAHVPVFTTSSLTQSVAIASLDSQRDTWYRVVDEGVDPTVVITSPANGAIKVGAFTVQAAASDTCGVAKVVFEVSDNLGRRLTVEDSTAPYEFLTKGFLGGVFETIRATVVDATGHEVTTQIQVNHVALGI